jgi:2-oxoisovalerate dehydrogenase E2 component (dihydrolipoyl transacylase)
MARILSSLIDASSFFEKSCHNSKLFLLLLWRRTTMTSKLLSPQRLQREGRYLYLRQVRVLASSTRSFSSSPAKFNVGSGSGVASFSSLKVPLCSSVNSKRFQSSPAVEDDDSTSTIPFLLADIGEGISEVECLQWFVHEGETVKQFDRICEVQSDKATVEITSRFDGRIVSLGGAVGDMIKVGSPLLYIQAEGQQETLHTSTASTSLEEPSYDEQLLHKVRVETDHTSDDFASKVRLETDHKSDDLSPVLTTPAIRKLAKEYDLDLRTIAGSGPKGRVLEGDVLSFLRESGKYRETQSADPTSRQQKNPSTSVTPTSSSSSAVPTDGQPLAEDTIIKLKGYNRLMVQSMTTSLQIPHMVYSDEVDMGSLMKLKGMVSVLPYTIKAVSLALLDYPLLNATFDGTDQVTLLKNHNIGVAMATHRGLVVPVIHECQCKSIADIADDLARLKELAKTSSFSKDDLSGATFTLSNIGAVGGGTYMSPIVTSPQVAIGAMGRIQRVPRFVGDTMEVEEAHIMNISWAGDHRVVDGATMARFHNTWKQYMESPVRMISNLK